MAAPVAGIAIRYLAQRVGGFVLKTVAKQYGKRTSRQRMVEVGRKLGTKPLAPALQGPYSMAPGSTQSTRGEHSQLAGHLKTRKSMRGGSAQKPSKSMKISDREFRRYLRRHEDEEYMSYYDRLLKY